MDVHDDFLHSIDPYWTQVSTGGGFIKADSSRLRLGFESARSDRYTDAQIDDYTMLSRKDYLWRPPLRMTVRARFFARGATGQDEAKGKDVLKGTAGFGFWNNPFSLNGSVKALPEAIWFFYSSPPANMALVPRIPGWGWKAQSLHVMRPGAVLRTLPLLATYTYGKLTHNTAPSGPALQKLAAAHEALVTDDMREWHTYTLEWRKEQASFWVDGRLLLHTQQPPRRPLGFVAWLDNQYAVATPEGSFEFGKVATGKQWLELDFINIEKL